LSDDRKTVEVTRQWLEGTLSTVRDIKADRIELALVEREDGVFVLSGERVGNKIVPKFKDSDNFKERNHESYEKAIAAGLSPIWRDDDGKFCRRKDDADGKPEFYIENADRVYLFEAAGQAGLEMDIQEISNKALVNAVLDHFGYEVPKSDEE